MTVDKPLTSVLAVPGIEPGAEPAKLQLPHGLTVAEMLPLALPAASQADLHHCRVALVTREGMSIVHREHWARLRPRPGVQVVIRLIPRKEGLRAVMTVVVAIAAVAVGAFYGAGFAAAIGLGTGTAAAAAGTAILSMGVNLVGNMLVNYLIPPVTPPSQDKTRNSYSITGFRNRLEPDGAVPMVMGTVRFAPPFAARTYTEIVGDLMFARLMLNLGEGEVEIDDIRIGETSIGEYDDVATELRYGVAGEDPCFLYPRQVVEEQIGLELTRPLPRDSLGEYVDGEAEETPVVRTCGPDASGANVIIAFPGGLVRFNDEGERRKRTVVVRIEQRLAEGDEWQEVTTLEITAKKPEGFFRQHSWTFPTRGRWQVRLTRMTDESKSDQVQDGSAWAALQTLRPEYPINYPKPLALLSMRIKATHQLNGALDNISVLARRVCLDWDSGTQTWIRRATKNPASLYRLALQHASNPKPVADGGIDLDALAAWHEFCDANGLTYCRVLEDADVPLREALTEIAAAGRGRPRHDGTKWTVVIDRPGGLIVDHIHPRNSWNFSLTRTYTDPPDGLVVKFQDASNDYKDAQRIVPWPGFEGEPSLLETLDQRGNTDAESIYREGYRRALEVKYRPDVFEVTQDGSVRVATVGDNVSVTYDVLDTVQVAARVVQTEGALIELDEIVTMEAGKSYGIRFRKFAETAEGEAPDTIGTSLVRTVQTVPGETHVLTLEGSGDMPGMDDWILFGEAGSESFVAQVTAVEATEDMCSLLRLVDAAPEIDQELDALEIPAWSGRVGASIEENLEQPSAPRFTSVTSEVDADAEGFGGFFPGGASVPVDFLIEPGSGTVEVAYIVVEYQKAGDPDWVSQTIPVGNGGGRTPDYPLGTVINLRAYAISLSGVTGPTTPELSISVGEDAALPAALDDEAIAIATLLGGAQIQFATTDDVTTTQVQLYRSTSDTLDRETDAVGAPIVVSPLQTFSTTVGDTGRTDLVTGGDMDDPGAWTLDAGWAIAGGVATHTPGTADDISQPLSIAAGKYYRIGLTIAGRTAGTVTPYLLGGTDRPGAARSADGTFADRIQAVTDNDELAFRTDTGFDGTLDEVVAYLETEACLDQGTHYLWLEPQSAEGLPGPASGPFQIEIV
ncbi:MAG: hypothetical protein GOVbin2371_49 [Prokaryotic dsDNA virus sp.]|nr:MAG: hypothetical protein GOVbin2371_49 [Prokaryotic dsDNA virus sp.]|tara:strand:- start:1298 stop:4699 length:3402 start_codon:yes stop_codon:yes gene_type:complete